MLTMLRYDIGREKTGVQWKAQEVAIPSRRVVGRMNNLGR